MKHLRKTVALILIAALLIPAFSVFAEREKPLIGIIQSMEHGALDAAREGLDAMMIWYLRNHHH